MRRSLLVVTCLAVPACSSIPKMPDSVPVVVEKLVPVPDKLTLLCDEVEKKGDTYGEAVRLANARLAALKECNARMSEIRKLGESE